MAKMGQHWILDVSTSDNSLSWTSANMMPIVPMYHTTGPNIGKLNAFFFGSPVCQDKTSNDWDIVPMICGLTE